MGSKEEEIFDFMVEVHRPVTHKEIKEATGIENVHNQLGKMLRGNRIKKLDHGLYEADYPVITYPWVDIDKEEATDKRLANDPKCQRQIAAQEEVIEKLKVIRDS